MRSVSALPKWQTEALQAAEASIRLAIDRDPHSLTWRRRQMHFYLQRGRTTGMAADFNRAAQAAEAALALYPEHPRGLVALGDCQLAEGEATHDRALLEKALASYQEAVALDDKRLSWERLQRFTETEQAEIRAKIDRARR
jgi:tetratricopeptide (TPR) repeat protein